MPNSFVTNKKTDYVAMRAAEAAPYLTVGAKKYFGDQLEGKRNGQTYEFIVKDAGEYVTGVDLTGHVSNIVERRVPLSINIGNIAIDTNIIETITDTDFDEAIAMPQGQKLVEGVVQDVLKRDIGQQNTAFVGKGWLPLNKAARYLGSVSSDKKYAFVDPMIDSIMGAQGKSFTPAESEPLYRTGLLGSAFGAEFREQQFLPSIEISADLANELATAVVSGLVHDTNNDVIKLTGVSETIPAGTPIFISGVYATNLVGNKTSALKAFVALEDGAAGVVKVAKTDFEGSGTKEACTSTGANVDLADLASTKLAQPIAAGTYYMGIFRVNGAFEFESLSKLDWSNADETSDTVAGIKVHTARAVDVITGSNKTRFSIPYLAGIVDKRGSSLVLIKDSDVNLVTL